MPAPFPSADRHAPPFAAPGIAAAGRDADAFLAALADPARPVIDAGAILLVVAHPDDETIGLGAGLPRLPGIGIVHVTDGAPRRGGDVSLRGFGSPAAYAVARRAELEAAMALAGVPADALLGLDVPDQESVANLAAISRRLAALFRERGTAIVLTHAYEGGHPDHEACAFAVQAACELMAEEGVWPPAVIEMPFYACAPDGGWRVQAFAEGEAPGAEVHLTPRERRLKQAMLDAHASQAAVLRLMPPGVERFRVSPGHDFTRLPNGGALLYERQDWGLTGAGWRAAVEEARRELGLEADA